MATQSYRILAPDGTEFVSAGTVLACARALSQHPRLVAARDAATLSEEARNLCPTLPSTFTTELVDLP